MLLLLQLQLQSNAYLFVCFAQQSIISINNVNTSAIRRNCQHVLPSKCNRNTTAEVTTTGTRTNNVNRNILSNGGQLGSKQPAALTNKTHDHDDQGSATATPCWTIVTPTPATATPCQTPSPFSSSPQQYGRADDVEKGRTHCWQ